MCKGLFFHYCVLSGRTKLRGLGPKADNIYTVGVKSLQLLLVKPHAWDQSNKDTENNAIN